MPINNAVNTENGALYNETVKKKEIVSNRVFYIQSTRTVILGGRRRRRDEAETKERN